MVRETQAIELRLAGASFREIGRQLNVTRQRATQIVDHGLDRMLGEPAEKLRQVEVARLERMTRALWPLALNGRTVANDPIDRGAQQRAVLRILQISDRRAKLLGLDAPIKFEGTMTVEERADAMAQALIDFQAGVEAGELNTDAREVVEANGHSFDEAT